MPNKTIHIDFDTLERFMVDGQMAPVSHYCHSVRAGNLVWVSGIVGMRADGTIPDDTVAQFDIADDVGGLAHCLHRECQYS